MAVTIETDSRARIRAALSAKFGSINKYCAERQIPYTTLSNLLKGFGSIPKNMDIISKVNEDVDTDLSAWER